MKKIRKKLLNYQKYDNKKVSWRNIFKTLKIASKKENQNALYFKQLLDQENWQEACDFIKNNPINLSWHSAAYPKCAMSYFLNAMGEPVYKKYEFVLLAIFSHLLNKDYPIYESFMKYKNLVSIEGVGGNYLENVNKNLKKGSMSSGVDLLWLILRKSTLDAQIKKEFIFYLLDNGFNPKRVFMPHIKKTISFIVMYEKSSQDPVAIENTKIYKEIFERLLAEGFDPNSSIEEEFGSRVLLSKNIAALDIAALSFSKSTIDSLLHYGGKLKNEWHDAEKISSFAYIKEQQKIIEEKSLLNSLIPIKDQTKEITQIESPSVDPSQGKFSVKL